MKPHVFLDEAAIEFADAFHWYESRSAGLGRRFFEAAMSTVIRVCETPLGFPLAQDLIRSARVFGFPYSVFFANETDVVVIYAVFHEKRNPRIRLAARGPGA